VKLDKVKLDKWN